MVVQYFIQEQAHLVCDDSGKLAYIAGVFLDLTSEVKRREDSHDFIKEDEKVQLEMFRSFVEKISAGEEIEQIKGDFTGETKKTVDLINRSIENIMGVLGEILTISKAGKEGHLSIRANDSKYPGGWGMLLRELNGALDAIISPLNEILQLPSMSERIRLMVIFEQEQTNLYQLTPHGDPHLQSRISILHIRATLQTRDSQDVGK